MVLILYLPTPCGFMTSARTAHAAKATTWEWRRLQWWPETRMVRRRLRHT